MARMDAVKVHCLEYLERYIVCSYYPNDVSHNDCSADLDELKSLSDRQITEMIYYVIHFRN